MKFLVCLLVTLGVAYGSILPLRSNCAAVFCTMDLKICPDGTPAPVPAGGCCPSLTACGTRANPIKSKPDCRFAMCTMDLKICPDGTPAPVPADGCCPSYSACRTSIIARRSNPFASLGSLLSGGNVLQTLTSATHGTDLGTVLSILNLLNNVKQLSDDVHHIPLLINQTIAGILNGTGQASQIVVDQLLGAVNSVTAQGRGGLDFLGALAEKATLLSSVTNLLPKGTSIQTVLSILSLLNNVNKLSNDVHQIPVLLNHTLASLVGGAGQASDIVVKQLLGLIGSQPGSKRDLLSLLGQKANLLSSVSNLLPKGTSIQTVLSILNLLNNVNKLSNDVHQIPVLINQTLASLVGGAGQASGIVVQQLLNLVGAQQPASGRSLLGVLGQNTNLLSSVSHLLPQGTSITTVLSLLNLLGNVNALNNDLHQIPVLLQETVQNLLNGVSNLLPPTLQPVIGSS